MAETSELIEFRRAFVWLLCGMLLPSVALVAFGVVAVANERAAVGRRLAEDYDARLRALGLDLLARLDKSAEAVAAGKPDPLVLTVQTLGRPPQELADAARRAATLPIGGHVFATAETGSDRRALALVRTGERTLIAQFDVAAVAGLVPRLAEARFPRERAAFRLFPPREPVAALAALRRIVAEAGQTATVVSRVGLGPPLEGFALAAELPGDPAAPLAFRNRTLYIALLVLLYLGIGVGFGLTIREMRRAYKLSRMKTDFVANISHELRTPLTGAPGATSPSRWRTTDPACGPTSANGSSSGSTALTTCSPARRWGRAWGSPSPRRSSSCTVGASSWTAGSDRAARSESSSRRHSRDVAHPHHRRRPRHRPRAPPQPAQGRPRGAHRPGRRNRLAHGARAGRRPDRARRHASGPQRLRAAQGGTKAGFHRFRPDADRQGHGERQDPRPEARRRRLPEQAVRARRAARARRGPAAPAAGGSGKEHGDPVRTGGGRSRPPDRHPERLHSRRQPAGVQGAAAVPHLQRPRAQPRPHPCALLGRGVRGHPADGRQLRPLAAGQAGNERGGASPLPHRARSRIPLREVILEGPADGAAGGADRRARCLPRRPRLLRGDVPCRALPPGRHPLRLRAGQPLALGAGDAARPACAANATAGQAGARGARRDLRRRRRHPARLCDLRQVGGRPAERGELPPDLRSPGFRARFLRAQRGGGSRVQVHGLLRPRGRDRRALGQRGHRVADRAPAALPERRRPPHAGGAAHVAGS